MSLSFFGSHLITIELLVGLAFGIYGIMTGSRMREQAFSRPSGKPRRDERKLWQYLLTWQVLHPGSSDPALLGEFSASRDVIQSSALIGGGLALVLAVVGASAIALAATGTVLSLSAGLGSFLTAVVGFPLLIGYSLGYVHGVWHLRCLTARGIAYGDLQSRRPSDYRSVAFPWIASILITWALLMPLLLAPDLGPKVSLLSLSDHPLAVPGWALEAIPAVMCLMLVTGEFVTARIAGLPRLLLTSHPQTAQRADNLLRAMTIGTLQGLEFIVIGSLATAQWYVITGYLGQIGFFQTSSWLSRAVLPMFLFPWAVGVIGCLCLSWAGRLGGTISGWPWRPMRHP